MFKNKLPVYKIAGTKFWVDADRAELRQIDNPSNTISFNRDMIDKGTHYEFEYDRTKRNIAASGEDNGNLIHVKVPQMTLLDPMRVATKYGLEKEDIKNKTDFALLAQSGRATERLEGTLPTIKIEGYRFIIDLQRMELRSNEDPNLTINLRNPDIIDDGHTYVFFFNTPNKKVMHFDTGMLRIPKDVVQVTIPKWEHQVLNLSSNQFRKQRYPN